MSLDISRSMSYDSIEIREHIMQFYNLLYSEQFSCPLKLDSLSFLSIDTDETNWLDRSFEESEVLEVVRDLNGNKVSDLDGFSIAVSQKCWEVLLDDAMEVFKEFHS